VQNVANLCCIGFVMLYLLLLIVLVVTPLFKQRRPATRNREKEGMEGPIPEKMQDNEDEQPAPLAGENAAQVSQPQA